MKSHTIFALIASLGLAQAQFKYTDVTVRGTPTSVAVPAYFLNPTGVVTGPSQYNVTVPLVCNSVCWTRQAYYGLCILGATPPNSDPNDAGEIDQEFCQEELCQPSAYNHVLECLKCIVANGGERGHADTASGASQSASATSSTDQSSGSTSPAAPESTESASSTATQTDRYTGAFGGTPNPWPPLGLEQANAWLRNITRYCEEAGVDVEGETSITLTATATGPYATAFASGDTASIPHWTRLATISQVISDKDAEYRSAYLEAFTGSPRPGSTTADGYVVPEENAAGRIAPGGHAVGLTVGIVGVVQGLRVLFA